MTKTSLGGHTQQVWDCVIQGSLSFGHYIFIHPYYFFILEDLQLKLILTAWSAWSKLYSQVIRHWFYFYLLCKWIICSMTGTHDTYYDSSILVMWDHEYSSDTRIHTAPKSFPTIHLSSSACINMYVCFDRVQCVHTFFFVCFMPASVPLWDQYYERMNCSVWY